MTTFLRHTSFLSFIFAGHISLSQAADPAKPFGPPLKGTQPLTLEGDIASALVNGVDRFLDRRV